MKGPNPAHTLDGGIPSLLQAVRHWPAASDEHRWAAAREL
jgi:hypothetical protein